MRVIPRLNQRKGADSPGHRPRRLRAIAVLPTMATLCNLLCGFAAIHFCMRALFAAGEGVLPFEMGARDSRLLERLLPSYLAMAGYLIFLGMLFDVLDGRLARLARRTTEFGGQLDSLADMVSFVLAPALLMLALLSRQLEGEWVVTPLGDTFGRAAWIMAALYVACGAIRLARFNVENEPSEQHHKYFKGLPVPGAASLLASLIILHEWAFRLEAQAVPATHGTWSKSLVRALPLVALCLSLLMVSRVRYIHFGNVFLGGRRPIIHVLLLVTALMLVVVRPEIALTAYLLLYAISGPATTALRRLRKPAAAPALAVEDANRAGDPADSNNLTEKSA
jgi:CDP-diacylglycerol--serine O-phosphatidyltransferase